MATKSLSKDELREKVLKEAVDRFNHESMDAEERLELRERILRLRKKTEKAGRLVPPLFVAESAALTLEQANRPLELVRCVGGVPGNV